MSADREIILVFRVEFGRLPALRKCDQLIDVDSEGGVNVTFAGRARIQSIGSLERRLANSATNAYYSEAMSTLTPKSIDRLVLGTVNASYRTELDADQLASAILLADVDGKLPHLATFFGEVKDKLILAFADTHGISLAKLRAAYKAVKAITGETKKGLERDFAHAMGRAA